jgi:hypothetical protein
LLDEVDFVVGQIEFQSFLLVKRLQRVGGLYRQHL